MAAAEPSPRWFRCTRLHGSAYHCLSHCKQSPMPAEDFQATWHHEAQQITGLTLFFNMCLSHAWLIIQVAAREWGHLLGAGRVERSLGQQGKAPASSMTVAGRLWGIVSIPALLQGTSGKWHHWGNLLQMREQSCA